jgi:TetR/AcrR family transcriptional regulator
MTSRVGRGEQTRRQILQATRSLLSELGSELTLEHVAQALGVTKQAVLYHFDSKERMLIELSLEGLVRECEVAVGAVAGRIGVDALEHFVRALYDFYSFDLETFRLIYLRPQTYVQGPNATLSPEERAHRVHAVTGRMYDAVEAALSRSRRWARRPDARELVVGAHFVAIGMATMAGLTAASGDAMKRPIPRYLDTLLLTWREGIDRRPRA